MKRFLFCAILSALAFVAPARASEPFFNVRAGFIMPRLNGEITLGKNTEKLEALKLYGFDVAASYVHPIVGPLCVEGGLQMDFMFKKETDNLWKLMTAIAGQYTFIDLKIPVGLAANLDFGFFKLIPYAGLDPTFFLKGSVSGAIVSVTEGSVAGDVNLLSRSEMGDRVWNSFVLGWHAGVRFGLGNFLIGASYMGPITDMHNIKGVEEGTEYGHKANLSQVSIEIGWLF